MFYVITDKRLLEPYHPKPLVGPVRAVDHTESVHPINSNETSALLQEKIAQTYDRQTEESIAHPLLVESIMSQPVVTFLENTPIEEALGKMKETGFKNFPVTSPKGELIGIVSDRELLSAAKTRVSEVMSIRVIGVDPKAPIRQLVAIMLNEKISSVPVVSPLRAVLGIVTTTDILKTFLTHAAVEIWR